MGSWERFFGGMYDNERRCYLRVSKLKEAARMPKVLDALLKELKVPGKSSVLRSLSDDDKFDAIVKQLKHESESTTGYWHKSAHGEILAGSIWRCNAIGNNLVLRDMFSNVRRECDLLNPVGKWLRRQGLEAHAEIPMGRKRTDVVGYRPPRLGGLLSPTLVAVELKNEMKEMERAIDQMTSYADYAHCVYLACTPAMAAEYLEAHADARGVKHWDSEVLDRKLKKLGFGLLLIEGSEISEYRKPRENQVPKKNIDEVRSMFSPKTLVHDR